MKGVEPGTDRNPHKLDNRNADALAGIGVLLGPQTDPGSAQAPIPSSKLPAA
jgi:hypothetical protein